MTTIDTLTQQEKELVAVAASIASGCLPCTTYHIKAVRKAEASEAEVLGAIQVALDVRDNATEMMAEAAQGSLNYEYPGNRQPSSLKQPIHTLAAIGAALACNSVADLEYYWTIAMTAGVSPRQIQTAIGIARAVRKEAAEEVDIAIEVTAEKQNGSLPQPCRCS